MSSREPASPQMSLNISRLHFRLKRLKGLESLSEKEMRDLYFVTKQRVFLELFSMLGVDSVREFVGERNRERVSELASCT